MFEKVSQLISEKKCQIGIVGLGYVGLPNLVSLATNGYHVIGFDILEEKIQALNAGRSYISDISDEQLQDLITKEVVSFTSDYQELRAADIIFIDVPTPIDSHQIPDISYVEKATSMVISQVRAGQVLVLESTVFPSTTEKYLVNKLTEQGWAIGKDIFVAYSPERINPGDGNLNVVPKVVGGVTANCSKLVSEVLSNQTHIVSSPIVAELSKLHENTFRFVNIALANELTQICDKLEVDPFEVIDASDSKPFGFMKFTPAVGIGGHCIPVDPYYTSWYMKGYGMTTEMIEAASRVNESMIDYTVKRVLKLLVSQKQSLTSGKIAIVGATYKKNVPDYRMSPVPKLIKALASYNFSCEVYDDLLTEMTSESGEVIPVKKVNYPDLNAADMTLLLVDHDYLDYRQLVTHSQLLIDTKNSCRDINDSRKITL